jgi:L-lactate dehydrogenase (cytochrome)
VACGADGLIVSNHGGRQLDAARSSVECLREIVDAVPEHIVVMADSGVESGVDIARFLANGAQMVFSGRSFLYGVAAHGEPGAAHTIDLLKEELQQVLGQLHCDTPADLVQHLVV